MKTTTLIPSLGLKNKRLGLLLGLGLVLALLLGAGPTAAQDANSSRMRFVHAVVDGPSVDIFLAGNLMFAEVPYRSVTPYRLVPQGNQFVRVVLAGTGANGTVVREEQVNFQPGQDLTLIFLGRPDQLQPWAVTDDNSLPEPGMARVRVLHAARETPPLDVCLAGTDNCWVRGLPHLENEPRYIRMNPGVYNVDFRETGTNTVFRNVPGLQFEAGGVYTVFVVGQVRDSEVGLQVMKSVDAGPGAGSSLPPPSQPEPVPPPQPQPQPQPQPEAPPPALPPETGAFLAPEVLAGVVGVGLLLVAGVVWFVRGQSLRR